MSDVDKNGVLGVDEFAVAMHLCVGVTKRQLPMPMSLPVELEIPHLMPKPPKQPMLADALSSALSDSKTDPLNSENKGCPVTTFAIKIIGWSGTEGANSATSITPIKTRGS
jgi:hypothetical protein